MSHLGKQGGLASAPKTAPREAGTPKTGFDSAPKNEFITFKTPAGIPGSSKVAR